MTGFTHSCEKFVSLTLQFIEFRLSLAQFVSQMKSREMGDIFLRSVTGDRLGSLKQQ